MLAQLLIILPLRVGPDEWAFSRGGMVIAPEREGDLPPLTIGSPHSLLFNSLSIHNLRCFRHGSVDNMGWRGKLDGLRRTEDCGRVGLPEQGGPSAD
jgi:hypothetical protein